VILIYVLLIVIQFFFNSISNEYLSKLELIVVFSIVYSNRLNSISQISILLFVLCVNDIVVYSLLGQQAFIFFIGYGVLALLEKVAPFLTKGFSFISNIIFLSIYLIINSIWLHSINYQSIIINFIVLIVLRLFRNIMSSNNEIK
jgi:hypothetical protein